MNLYLARATDSDVKAISSCLTNYRLLKKRNPRDHPEVHGVENDFLEKASKEHPRELVRQVISIGRKFDSGLAKQSIIELKSKGLGAGLHGNSPWELPGGETTEAKARRIYSIAVSTDIGLGSAAFMRRLSHILLDYAIRAIGFPNFFEIINRGDLGANGVESEKKLKYRQRAGKRWSILEREFGAGILLLPGIEFPNYLYEIRHFWLPVRLTSPGTSKNYRMHVPRYFLGTFGSVIRI